MTKRKKLIEKLGVYFENKEHLAPLAARILSTLILTGKQGITFDALVLELSASKSTISSHLTTLQAANRITYHTKSGDRKKYFTLVPDAMIQSMAEMVKNWKCERELHVEIMDYKKEINETLPKNSEQHFDLEFHTEYLEFLDQASLSIEKLKKRLTEKNKND
ncbi:putative transcriptional regulator [Aequorivita sublithincola DSM 14238]|uniref:Putative transcriptional regulator n=1 Tax=Aequorivita sublithincola (strain DSM 14238 / LMG 21431 / ACAM 643 / 9-3) TaxID=746697 RepID=I3YUC3_AEQSU|nr:transcriptional regulator [Aequorivita sublithincola]AFL80591.1 putative transcriptional regulator [Aequorivita sublithincola DSM 14238]